MGEGAEPKETDSRNFREISRRRIFVLMAAALILSLAIAAIFGPVNSWFGVLLGGILAYANFFWLDASTRAMFSAGESTSSAFLAVKYVLRYLLLGVALWVISLTRAVPMAAVIGGLAIFAAAIMLDGMIAIFNSNFKRDH